jgi:hypothetical protein
MPIDVAGRTASASDLTASAGFSPSNFSITGWEQLYSPIVVRLNLPPNSNDISGFEIPQSFSGGGTSGPFGGGTHVGPTRTELDPYFTNILDGDGSTFLQECDYQMMMNNATGSSGGDANIRKVNRDEITAVVVNHHRGPMVLSGWGFDIADRAVPSYGSDPFSFDPALVNNRQTWKTGPVDLKWDFERKVWSGGHHMICGVAIGAIEAPESPCKPKYFSIKVMRNNQAGGVSCADCITNEDTQETVQITNRDPSLDAIEVESMIWVVAARINYEWIPVWVGCPDPVDPDSVDLSCVI